MIGTDTDRTGPWGQLGTLASALWLCGGQWTGNTAVARTLAGRYGLVAYHYDYHDARSHHDRLTAERVRNGASAHGPDLEWQWVTRTPGEMVAEVLADSPPASSTRWTTCDPYPGNPVIAEGWGLRPGLVLPVLDSPRRMVVMLPTDEFCRWQAHNLPRAPARWAVSDPERAQANRLERHHLVAQDAAQSAERLGTRVLWIDGSFEDTDEVADLIAEHWTPYPPGRRPGP